MRYWQMVNEQSMDPLHTCIACSVLQPSLRSLLIFDAPFIRLEQIARQMVALAAEAGQKLRPVIMSAMNDDDLWGVRIFPGRDGRLATHAQLFSLSLDDEIPLIIIPDLATLSLASARACIMLVGATVAHLERHGQQEAWTPRYYWLAGCKQEDVGSVSSHLLDRFALRLAWHAADQLAISHQERLMLLQRNLQQGQVEDLPPLDSTLIQQIKQAMDHSPLIELTDEANEELLTYFTGDVVHTRRELALARCSLALAQLSKDATLQDVHVEQAAKLMGLQKVKSVDNAEASDQEQPQLPDKAMEEKQPSPTTPSPEAPGAAIQQPMQRKSIDVQAPEPNEQSIVDYVTSAPDPYPEDTQPVLREANSLQLPQRHFVGTRSDRGPIIGIEPTTTLRDLALVSTLMRALLFQAVRPKQDATSIVVDWTDLRRYRRAAEPERLLLVLLDYTSMPLRQRQQALVRYLSEAYIERAGITIIKVGAASDSTKSELRARYVSARSILVPAISDAIDAPAGSATPLAHGLELALQIMRRSLQHGRSAVQQITFVVVTDGRGNVPLQASHSNTITRQVTHEGVEDALRQAQEIRQMKYVSSFVLSPRLRYYPELPQRLADALNAPLTIVEDEEGGQV